MGDAGTDAPTLDRSAPETDPEPKDAGQPAEGTADPKGSSGAEDGLSPWTTESYSEDAEGPTTSTED